MSTANHILNGHREIPEGTIQYSIYIKQPENIKTYAYQDYSIYRGNKYKITRLISKGL